MRFIATADWQLGMTAAFLDDEARPRFQQARFDALRRIGDVARDSGARFVVVGGDVFESNQLDRSVLLRTFEALRSIDVPVILVPGNHDPLDASSIYDSKDFEHAPANVTVVRTPEPRPVGGVDGVEVVGVPWFSKRPTEDLVAAALEGLEPAADGVVRVLVGHGDAMIGIGREDEDSVLTVDVPTVQRALDAGVVDVAILGDRHSTTQVAPRIWYPGTPEVTRRTETDPGNVLVVDVDAADRTAVAVEVVHVGRWSFRVFDAELDSRATVDAFLGELDAVPDKDRTVVWYKLGGGLSVSDRAALDDGLEDRTHLFAALQPWERHQGLVTVPDDGDFDGLDLGGFTMGAVGELRDMAVGDGDDARTAQDALALLYRFAGGAK